MEISRDKIRKWQKKARIAKIPRQRLIAYATFNTIEGVLKIGSVRGEREGWSWNIEIDGVGYIYPDSSIQSDSGACSTCDGWLAVGKNHKQAAGKIVKKLEAEVQRLENEMKIRKGWLSVAEKGLSAIAE